MKKKAMVKILNDYRLQFIICSSFRYSLGRRSYSVGLVQEWIKENESIVDTQTIDTMISDLDTIILRCQRMKDYSELGFASDRKSWEEFLAYLLRLKDIRLLQKEKK